MSRDFSVQLRFATLRTKDLPLARRFYGDVLGLPQTREERGQYFQFDAGGAELCIDRESEEPEPRLIFVVDRLDGLLSGLRAAGVAFEGPLGNPGRRYVLVRDPDQNLLVFEESQGR